jgi:predicted enzyme related to lactoylglutathione lyase
MAKVIGVGGIFFKTPDWDSLRGWYKDALGIEFSDWGGAIFTPEMLAGASGAATVFTGFAQDTDYFAPSAKDYMINLMVDDLDAVLERCKACGVEPVKAFPDEANGHFAHIIDPEGRKIELWQPKAMG